MKKIMMISILTASMLIGFTGLSDSTTDGLRHYRSEIMRMDARKFNKEYQYPLAVNAMPEDITQNCIGLYLEFFRLHPGAAWIKVNGHGPFDPPKSCSRSIAPLGGILRLPKGVLKEGKNTITIIRRSGSKSKFSVGKICVVAATNETMMRKLERKLRADSLADFSFAHSRSLALRYEFISDLSKVPDGSTVIPYFINFGGDWRIDSDHGRKIIRLAVPKKSAVLVINAFGQNAVFSGKFRIDKLSPLDSPGAIYFLGRTCNYPDWKTAFGYNFAAKRWEGSEYMFRKKSYGGTKGMVPKLGRWYDFRLELSGRQVTLFINNLLVLRTKAAINGNYGRCGFVLENIAASFADIKLCCEAIPMDGVTETVVNLSPRGCYTGGLNPLRLNNGSMIASFDSNEDGKRVQRYVISNDNGCTWQRCDNPFPGVGSQVALMRLANRRLLAVHPRIVRGRHNQLVRWSDDEGKNWSKAVNITGEYCVMPGKVTQVSSGRIFIPGTMGSGRAEFGTSINTVYSDDNGKSWSKVVKDIHSYTGLNLQEGQIIELSKPGRLMMVMRSSTPFSLMASISEDNGLTWGKPYPLPLPSVLCSFGAAKDSNTGEIFIFWTYDDHRQGADCIQFPRERIALARSRNDGKNWEFLGDIGCFGGCAYRYMNMMLFLDERYLYLTASIFLFDRKAHTALKFWRIDRSKLKPYPKFPPLH